MLGFWKNEVSAKEQKWGFLLFMLNIQGMDAICRLLIRKALGIDEMSFIQYLVSFIISLSLSFGSGYLLRHQPWKMKVWTVAIIFIIWLLASFYFALNKS